MRILILIGICILLIGCTTTRPLDTNVVIIGNPQTFHTEFEKGDWVVKYNDWHWLKSPIQFKGFQGIRYVDKLPELKSKITEVL